MKQLLDNLYNGKAFGSIKHYPSPSRPLDQITLQLVTSPLRSLGFTQCLLGFPSRVIVDPFYLQGLLVLFSLVGFDFLVVFFFLRGHFFCHNKRLHLRGSQTHCTDVVFLQLLDKRWRMWAKCQSRVTPVFCHCLVRDMFVQWRISIHTLKIGRWIILLSLIDAPGTYPSYHFVGRFFPAYMNIGGIVLPDAEKQHMIETFPLSLDRT